MSANTPSYRSPSLHAGGSQTQNLCRGSRSLTALTSELRSKPEWCEGGSNPEKTLRRGHRIYITNNIFCTPNSRAREIFKVRVPNEEPNHLPEGGIEVGRSSRNLPVVDGKASFMLVRVPCKQGDQRPATRAPHRRQQNATTALA